MPQSEPCPLCGEDHNERLVTQAAFCRGNIVAQRDALRAACEAMLHSMDYANDDRPLMNAVRAALAQCPPKTEGGDA